MSNSIVKNPFLIALCFLFISSNSIAYANSESKKLNKIYHVLVNGEHVGTVKNRESIESNIDQKLNKYKDRLDKFELIPSKEIKYIPEYTIRPVTEDEATLKWIDRNVGIETNAFEISFGENLLYTKDKQDAEKVLEQLKLKYVGQKDINNQDIIISLSIEPIIKETQTNPNNVLSVEKAIEYITKGTLEEKKHKVQEGEVLGEIAFSYNLTTSEILKLNPTIKEDSLLQIGQEITVTDYKPIVDVIVKEKVNKLEEIPYEVETIESEEMYKGDRKIKQNGIIGEKTVEYMITMKNGQTVSKEKINETILKEPVKEVVIQGTKVIPSRGTGSFTWPTVGGYISSEMGMRWGRLHKGTDIARPSNRAILAADNGTVTFAGWDGGFGNKIIINHNNGYQTLYAHLNSIDVKVGQTVSRGSTIGIMGTTGNSTGVHLHIELYKNGKLLDFLDYAN